MKIEVIRDNRHSSEMLIHYCCDEFRIFNTIWFRSLKMTPKGLFIKKPDDCFSVEENLNAKFLCCPFCGEDVMIVGSKR